MVVGVAVGVVIVMVSSEIIIRFVVLIINLFQKVRNVLSTLEDRYCATRTENVDEKSPESSAVRTSVPVRLLLPYAQ